MSPIAFRPLACSFLAGLTLTSAASAATFPVLLEQNYDSDTVGALPAGWTVASGAAPNAVVQTGVPGTPSAPNVFQVQQNGESFTIQTVMPTQVDLDENTPNLVWSAKLYVDELVINNSAGFQFKLWNADVSNLDAGYYRVLSDAAGTFRFFNPLAGGNGGAFFTPQFPMDVWHDVSVVIDPSSNSAGTVGLYVNGLLINTETYTSRGLGQTTNIDTLQILSQPNGTGDNRIYLDNLVIAVPEPASAAVLAIGGLSVLIRRRGA
jgi:hypothetical protein